MPKFIVSTDWSGYCRGYAQYVVEAKDEDEARENWYLGKEIERVVVRDDTESEVSGISEWAGEGE